MSRTGRCPTPPTLDYYLDSSGRANTAEGDGRCARSPRTVTATDTYLYDPRGPFPPSADGS